MTPDPFRLLGKPRRPWLDAGDLKDAFHRLTAVTHADRTGLSGASADLNAAYATLSDPAQRLRRLLELEHPEALGKTTEVPAPLADLFLRLATLRRAVGAFVQQRVIASTPLAQALLLSEEHNLRHDVQKALSALEVARAACEGNVQRLDLQWERRTPEDILRLALWQQELSYLGKWEWQLREALFQLETRP